MYKKFLVSMLLTVALAGCNHQPSDKQGDQSDTTMPVQDQMVNPENSSESDTPMSVSPQSMEPSQTPSDTTPSATSTPDISANPTDKATSTKSTHEGNSSNSAAGAQ